MLTSTCAILPCSDMDRTVAFYQGLGFQLEGRWDSYLIFTRDAVELHFACNPDHVAAQSDHAAYFRTDDVDTLNDEFEGLEWVKDGFPRFRAAETFPWGMREIHILDPDGHLLRIGQFPDG